MYTKANYRSEENLRPPYLNEPFCNYYHEKVILINRIPIADDELLDYLIEGITDVQLQNQARLIGFVSKTELLMAFEKINFESGRMSNAGRRKDDARLAASERGVVPTEKRRPMKCY